MAMYGQKVKADKPAKAPVLRKSTPLWPVKPEKSISTQLYGDKKHAT